MSRLRNRWFILAAVVVALGIPGAWLLARDAGGDDPAVVATVKRGAFHVMVTTSGELRARKFVQIQGPPNMQQAETYQTKISSIVPEGTVVKEGDVVAELDRSGIAAKMAEVNLALQKAQAQYEQAMLDSTLNLSKAREEMRTMELSLEEKRLAKEQAVYEAPTVKRQAEIDHEKATRALAQAKVDYKTKTEQAQAKMREVGADLERQRNRLNLMQTVMGGFSIRAPAQGMVIYVKEWNGKKKVAGSQVGAWDPTVATLPDLSQMESITYVNEIDVRKIAVGQPVLLSLDSDPSKKLPGKVVEVANVGEQRPNADAKVFEVKVLLQQADTTLRPGMTTSNAIETMAIKDALFVPLEAVVNEGGTAYVYKRDGSSVVRQQVETGAMSDDEVVVSRGLAEGDRVLLSPPANASELSTSRLPGSSNTPPARTGDSAERARPVPVKPDTSPSASPAGAGAAAGAATGTGNAASAPKRKG
ncbi:MAG: efflux RND transporter periplasmic adaptor subunit [Gemmatimonadaceae bacterium]|nr:efflux RND transporter periplasmic adaptor subunit [Gemmatimonadaceae bacterium]